MKILLALSGSVACIKATEIYKKLSLHHEIKVISTTSGLKFLSKGEIEEMNVLSEHDEWQAKDSILHIELRKWADLMVIAPLSANTLAKISHGICDNLLTCVVRAWDVKKKILICPAMNTMMYEHPITNQQLEVLRRWGYFHVIDPVVKLLACGDLGNGNNVRLI